MRTIVTIRRGLLAAAAICASAVGGAENIAIGRPCAYSPAPNYALCSDAGDSAQLTDGKYDSGPGPIWLRKSTVGWKRLGQVTAMISVDLGETKPISGFSFSYAAGAAGVGWPDLAYVYVRESESEKWRYVGDLVANSADENGPPKMDRYAACRARSMRMPCRGRYVAMLVRSSNFIFSDEIEIYAGGKELLGGEMRGVPVAEPMTHVKLSTLCNRLVRDLDAVEAKAKDGASPETRAKLDAAASRLRERLAQLESGDSDPQEILTVLPMNVIQRDIYTLNAVVMRSHGIASPTLWTNNRWENLDLLRIPSEEEIAATVPAVKMMRGETRSAAVNVANPMRCPLTFRVSVKGFPQSANVECRQVVFTDTKMRRPVSGAFGKGGNPISVTVPAGTSGQVWITFRRPAGRAGRFDGEIAFEADGFPALRRGVSLVLCDVDMPERTRVHLGGWDYSTGKCDYFGTPGNAAANQTMMRSLHADTFFARWDAVRPKGAKFDGEGRLANAADLDFSGWDEWVARFSDARIYAVFLAVDRMKDGDRYVFESEEAGTARFARMVEEYFRAWAAHMQKNGVNPSQALFHLLDEPGEWQTEWKQMVHLAPIWARAIKKADENFMIFANPDFSGDPEQAGKEYYSTSDVICPKAEVVGNPASSVHRDFFDGLRRQGKRIWFYSCQGPSREMDPVSYYRQQFWLAFAAGAEGCAWWAFGCGGGIGDSYHAYRQPGVEFSPYFVSPTDVADSKQSEGLREGAEDYECLAMLKDAIDREKNRGRDVSWHEAVLADAIRTALNISRDKSGPVRADNVLWSAGKDRSCADRAHDAVLDALVAISSSSASCDNDIVLENESFRLVLGTNAVAKSLVVKANGEECLSPADRTPVFSSTQDRPYNNEIKLIEPTKRTTYPACSLRRSGEGLVAGFAHGMYEARIKVKAEPLYIAFELDGFVCDRAKTYDAGTRLKMDVPPVASFRVMQLPVANRRNFGNWLNASWDEKAAVGVAGTSPYPDIDHEDRNGYRLLTADLIRGRKLRGAGAAIIAAAGREPFLDAMDALERDFGLPHGVRSRRLPAVNASLFHTYGFRDMLGGVTPKNIDEVLKYVKAGGFKYMTFSYGDIVRSEWSWALCGNYDFRPEYPEGEKSLREMLAKVKAVGVTPGLHTLHSHIGLKSRYVTPVADSRLNKTRRFTLAKPLLANADATELEVFETTADAVMFPACRVLQFGGELVSYESYTTERPYRFIGVKRGAWNTRISAHPAGEVGGILDISEFGKPTSCYIDQDTDLQDEIAAKIAKIYNCGFEYMYLDGSEGVNAPFNFNIGYSQYRCWRLLEPEPLFAEGAAKTHFGWHMLSGANAFDCFRPEEFKEKLVEFPFRQAPKVWQDMTRCNFGWWHLYAPKQCAGPEATIGVQPDMWEFGLSVSVAWRCPVTMQADIADLRAHPRTADILETVRRWEEFRERDLMTREERREILSDYRQEHHLLKLADGSYKIVRCEQIPVGDGKTAVRAFLFEADGYRWVVYWKGDGNAKMSLPVSAGDIALFDEFAGRPLVIEKGAAEVTVPAEARVYLCTTLSADSVKLAFAAAKLL